jgi:ketosteroid isomerase-like protein
MESTAEDLARAWADAFARADRDACLGLMHPYVEMYLPRSALEGGEPYRGLTGASQAWADAFDIWERFEFEPLGFDTAGDVLVFTYRARCFPRREGPPVDYVAHTVIELRDGKIFYWRPHLDSSKARDDAEARAAPRATSD